MLGLLTWVEGRISLLACDVGAAFDGMWVILAGDILKAVISSNS